MLHKKSNPHDHSLLSPFSFVVNFTPDKVCVLTAPKYGFAEGYYKSRLFHKKRKESVRSTGYSIGLFNRIGSARIEPFVTVNNLSVGLTAGVDHLLGPNRKFG